MKFLMQAAFYYIQQCCGYGSGIRDGKIGSGVWDGKKSDPGSGINIPDPQH